jgi:hypothetical protein
MPSSSRPRNVLGTALEDCSHDPKTGWYRDGCCRTGEHDRGSHTVCARVTAEFLEFSQRAGNDLSTPRREFGFPGLKPGDSWCVCASRWLQAFEAGVAPPVRLEATHENAMTIIPLAALRYHALDEEGSD